MFEIEKTFTFEAGHTLPHHDGKCASPHGHSYILKVVVRGDRLHSDGPQEGMVLDFQSIKEVVKPMIDEFFDHKWLNESLGIESPTAEAMAKWIFTYLEPKIRGLYRVSLFETATSCASYFKDS